MLPTLPFLKTKIHPPVTRKVLVLKSLLLSRFVEGVHGPLTLVTAPAGFGKTTLVVSALSQCGMPAAWLSLDHADNLLERFLGYLLLTIQRSIPEIGKEAVELLEGSQQAPVEIVLTSLLNNLIDLNQALVLVLDDYHTITHPKIHEVLTFLLDHCPPAFHLVLISRSDPPISLARLRARGQVTEFRASDLRFTQEEAATFFNSQMGLHLNDQEVRALEERTEGWIAGIQMAALSMRDRKDTDRFIATFSGTNRYILDYLLEEVLANQPPEVQRFLLCTSILDRMCAPLCDALLADGTGSEGPSALEMLAVLERANLFLVSLDDERLWFRYHHLFSDLLRARFRQTHPGLDEKMHLRASAWFEDNGFAVETIHHALAGNDFNRAAQLVEKNTTLLLARGEMNALMTWISVLPEELRHTRPWLCVHQGYALAFAGRLSEVEPLLQQAEKAASFEKVIAGDPQWFAGAACAVRAMVATMAGRDMDAVQLATQARELLSEEHAWDRSAADWALGYAERSLGHLENATAAFEEMIRLARVMGNIWTLVTGLMDLANVARAQGKLSVARTLFEEALGEASRQGARSLGYIARMEAGLASVLYEQNQLQMADQLITAAILHVERWPNPNHRAYAFAIKSRLRLAQDDPGASMTFMQEADAIRKTEPLSGIVRGLTELGPVRLYLAAQKSSERFDPGEELAATCMNLIHSWAERIKEWDEVSPDEAGLATALMLVRVQTVDKQAGKAIVLASRVLQSAQEMENIPIAIEAQVLLALARQSSRPAEEELAFVALEAALQLGQPGGFVRVFLDEDLFQNADLLQNLLARWVDRAGEHPLRSYALFLLKQFPAKIEPGQAEPQPIPEPLTHREIEILSWIAQGLSNDAIAQQLVISPGTVKAHTAAIYRKLDVSSRTEAVARARQLHILP